MQRGRLRVAVTLAAVVTAGLAGCASVHTGEPATEAASPARAAAPAVAPVPRPYDLPSLMRPVLQLDLLAQSADYFAAFADHGDPTFERELVTIFGLEQTPYAPGQETRLVTRDASGSVVLDVRKALLGTGPGGDWWQVIESGGPDGPQEVTYQVLLSPERVPLTLRFIEPATGRAWEVPTEIGQSLEGARDKMTPQDIRAKLDHDLEREIQERWGRQLNDPKIIGEETIETPAGRFAAVHVRDERGDVTVDYWLAPQVPGGLIRVSSSQGGVTELEKIAGHAAAAIDPAEVQPAPAMQPPTVTGGSASNTTEGTPASPVQILVGEPTYGQVGPEETSYYSVTSPAERADIRVEVSEHRGDAELVYYGQDATFQHWIHSSEGSTMDVQEYYVGPGTTLYFAIADKPDEADVGESYLISASADPLLDPTGIRMRGEYRKQARPLQVGVTLRGTLGGDALVYYRTRMPGPGTLVVRAEGLPEGADLRWIDVDGASSSAVYWHQEGNATVMEVQDLPADAVCWYYVVATPQAALPAFQISASQR